MIDKQELKKYNLKPKSYKRINNAIIVNDDTKTLVFKKKIKDNTELFNYLKTRNFNLFPNYIYDDRYEISNYYENYNLDDTTKANDLVNIISLLHLKTTNYKNLKLNDFKKIYEDLEKTIKKTESYYLSINDQIENEIYMSPSHYLLARNISKMYNVFSYCKNTLHDWYEQIKNLKKIRTVQLHNNISLDHIIEGKEKILISWNNSKVDLPIYDLYNFYKSSYQKIDFSTIIQEYEKKYPLLDYERTLFFILISIPDKVIFTNDDYDNTKKVSSLYEYITKTDELISPYYSKDEEQ